MRKRNPAQRPITIDDGDSGAPLLPPKRAHGYRACRGKQLEEEEEEAALQVRAVSKEEFDAAVLASRMRCRSASSRATPSRSSRSPAVGVAVAAAGEEDENVFEMKPPPAEAGEIYQEWCVYTLCSEFPRATVLCVRQALKRHMRKLGPSYAALRSEYHKALARERDGNHGGENESSSWLPAEGFKLNKSPRRLVRPRKSCPLFDREFEIVKRRIAKEEKEASFECGCCFSECSFEQLAQCVDGHLFCFSCLRRHVEEATFGGGQSYTVLSCMDTAGCSGFFPASEVSRALPADVLSKYERRLAEESVARARLEGLVYCPFCNFPCELDPGFRVLDCPNIMCAKSSCVKCKEPNHLPLECHEVEKKTETSLRRQVEELMTKALVRECLSCKAELVKTDGCNKITCRCGQTMCYVCRQKISAGYSHFCQHAREPGKSCRSCNRCGLWAQESSDDVVKAAKEAAMQAAACDEPGILNKKIGPQERRVR
ncbi:E3 ubiquitin-protein ligase RNF216 [Selaginella moellendorffii]|uniref:E3 ubiquitin-protein ligase RNF216 n=1 Tax=Selaginella moellendorffii TaxID=88036 RepID=UPI000D1C662E|nr:E3 ubiquitin-protein ligase RNF216 [Selaginella moellendorffii]|eukprot:XP_024528430.1 E3 ubiquitin-protein ligase RNF216 [Selaginella moellendorffii]